MSNTQFQPETCKIDGDVGPQTNTQTNKQGEKQFSNISRYSA